MNTNQNTNPNPFLKSITFGDGSKLSSANTVDDFHIRKKLRTEQKADFIKDVEIQGDLIVHGSTTVEQDNTEITTYIDTQLLNVYNLIGWDKDNEEWKYSQDPYSGGENGTSLDARLLTVDNSNYYTKTETDNRILTSSTNAMAYYDGTTNVFTGADGTVYTNKRCSVIPITNHFIIPTNSNNYKFIIQNSSYGNGKVLTSDGAGVATWQNPTTTTNTITNINSSNGQSNTASFSIQDLTSPTINFFPNKAYNAYEVEQAGDFCVQTGYGTMTLTSGISTHVLRPAGIRMDPSNSGFLEIFGGWAFDSNNTTSWLRDGSNNYLGSKMGNSIRLDSTGVNVTHGGTSSNINLYGSVKIKDKATNSPAYNKNSDSIGASLTVDGLITTESIKITNNAQSGYVLTSDGTGNGVWAVPASSTTVNNFTDDVTFQGDIHVNDTTYTNGLQVAQSVQTNDIVTPSVYSLLPTIITTTGTGIDLTWGTTSSNSSADVNQNLLRGVNYYSDVKIIPYTDIIIPAGYENSVEFLVPIYLQHNWTFKNKTGTNAYQNENKISQFNFSFVQLAIIVKKNNAIVTRHDFTEPGDGQRKLGKVYYEFDRTNDFTASGNFMTTRDEDAIYIMHSRFEIDRVPFHFLPIKDTLNQTYNVEIVIQIKYLQNQGSDLVNYPSVLPSMKYPRMILQLGTQAMRYYTDNGSSSTLIPNRDTSLSTLDTMTFLYSLPYSNTGSIVNQRSYTFANKRFTQIKFWTDDQLLKSFSGYLNGKTNGSYDVNNGYTESFPSSLPSSNSMTPVTSLSMNTNNFLDNTFDSVKISNGFINRLYVADNIECTGILYNRGIGGRRGIGSTDGTTVNIRKIVTSDTQPSNSVFNWYWTGYIETWVDNTLVLTTPSNVSDYRLKNDIVPLKDVLEDLCELNIYDYTLNLPNPHNPKSTHTTKHHIGIIAHELQEKFFSFPHLVIGNKNAYQSQTVNYNELSIILMKSIQELNTKHELLKKSVSEVIKCIISLVILIFVFFFYINY